MKLANELKSICPIYKEKCMEVRCKFWKTFTRLESQTTSSSLYDFLVKFDRVCEAIDKLEDLLENVALLKELTSDYENEVCNRIEFNKKSNDYKNKIVLLRQSVEGQFKRICGKLQLDFVSINFESSPSTLKELGRVTYYGRSENVGECCIVIIANNLLDQSV